MEEAVAFTEEVLRACSRVLTGERAARDVRNSPEAVADADEVTDLGGSFFSRPRGAPALP